jgi:hypothetical protein
MRPPPDLVVEQGTSHHHALDLVGAFVALGALSPDQAHLAIYRESSG